jgi:hypothetical protein
VKKEMIPTENSTHIALQQQTAGVLHHTQCTSLDFCVYIWTHEKSLNGEVRKEKSIAPAINFAITTHIHQGV